MKTSFLNKKFILLFLIVQVCFSNFVLFAQPNTKNEIEAVDYFYNYILKVDASLKNITIKNPGFIEGSTDIYDVSYVLGEINSIKDSVPNRQYLDSIVRVNQITSAVILKNRQTIHIPFQVIGPLKGPKYKMHVYKSAFYKGNNYVEIVLNDKKSGVEKIICIQFNGEKIIKYYMKTLIYD